MNSSRPKMPRMAPDWTCKEIPVFRSATLSLAAILVALALLNSGRSEEEGPIDIVKLVHQLGSKTLSEEEEASYRLEALGKHSLVALERAAKMGENPVIRERASHLQERIEKQLAGQLRGFLGHTEKVNGVAFTPDGRRVLSGSTDKTVRLWDIATGRELRRLAGDNGGVQAIAVFPDGRHLAFGHWDYVVRVWDINTGKETSRCIGHEDFITSVAVSPDGQRILSGSHDGYMKLWDAGTGKEIRSFEAGTKGKVPDKPGAREEISCVAFSPDGRKALSAGTEGVVCLWDLETGKLLYSLPKHAAHVKSVLFSHDGRLILSGDLDGVISLWEIPSRKELRHFAARLYTKDGSILGKNDQWAAVASLAFSPDDRRVLSGHWDHTVRLWDVKAGKELACFFWHFNDVNSVAFSPDGKWALSGSRDKTVRLWSLPR